jgi:hypothetical protein
MLLHDCAGMKQVKKKVHESHDKRSTLNLFHISPKVKHYLLQPKSSVQKHEINILPQGQYSQHSIFFIPYEWTA